LSLWCRRRTRTVTTPAGLSVNSCRRQRACPIPISWSPMPIWRRWSRRLLPFVASLIPTCPVSCRPRTCCRGGSPTSPFTLRPHAHGSTTWLPSPTPPSHRIRRIRVGSRRVVAERASAAGGPTSSGYLISYTYWKATELSAVESAQVPSVSGCSAAKTVQYCELLHVVDRRCVRPCSVALPLDSPHQSLSIPSILDLVPPSGEPDRLAPEFHSTGWRRVARGRHDRPSDRTRCASDHQAVAHRAGVFWSTAPVRGAHRP